MARGTVAGSTLGTLVLGALMLRTAVSPAVSPATPTVATSQASSPSTLATTKERRKASWLGEEGPWKASQAHFAGFFPGTGCPPRKQRWCIPDNERVAAMIAIAPDPTHSHMALVFDRTLEAIKLAAQDMKYVADRYWLPWDISLKTDWADYDSFLQGIGDQKQREKQPGLLLFRWNKEESKQDKPATVLYVFLVTDTSTAGINGEQFSNAVEYLNEVCASAGGSTGGCAGPDPIHIMGPTFSGSLVSLRRLVEVNTPRNFAAYSGTVSSLCAQKTQHLLDSPLLLARAAWLCDQDRDFYNADDPAFVAPNQAFSSLCGPKNQNAPQENNPSKQAALFCQHYKGYEPAPHLTFHSLVSSTESGLDRFIESLHHDGDIKCDGTPEVAILSEEATAFGAAGAATRYGAPTLGEPKPSPCSVTFSFPREIASLRNASEASAKTPSSATSNPAVPSPYLPWNLADQSNRSDESPDFSTLQGPLSKEAVLMNFAAEMRRDHYKYIGVIGSNVLDVLFLTTFLRKSVPDARLFLVDSDLLLERDLDNAPYIGTLAVTTYPLVLRSLDWTNPGFSRLPFADQYEEGEFNAALLTMKETRPFEKEGTEFPYECGDQSCSQKTLPIWLTAVGTGGYWPVQMLSGHSPADGDPELAPVDFVGAWTVISVFLCALGFLHCGVLLRVWSYSPFFRDFSLLNPERGQRLFFIQAASATLALGLAMAGAPAWIVGPCPFLGKLMVVAIAVLLLTCVLLEVNYLMSRVRASKPRPLVLQIVPSIGVWCLAAGLALMWRALFENDDGSGYGLFFSYRTLHLATGVSPLTPMLPVLATIYLWAIGEVWRLRFNDQTRPRLHPTKKVDDAAKKTNVVLKDDSQGESTPKLRPGMGREETIAKSISRFPLSTTYAIFVALIFAAWFQFFDFRHAFELFERRYFGILYQILFCLVVALILSSGFRVAQVWLELKALLLELNRSPVRFTFYQVKDPGWSSLWRPGGDEVEWNYMVQAMELIRQLGTDKELAQTLKEEARNIEDTRRDIWATRKRMQQKSVLLPALSTTLEHTGWVRSANKKVAEDAQRLQDSVGKIQDYVARFLVGTAEDAQHLKDSFGKIQDDLARFLVGAAQDAQHLQDFIGKIQDQLARFLVGALDVLQDNWTRRFPRRKDDEENEKEVRPVIVYCREQQNEKDRRVVAYHYQEDIDPKEEQQTLLEKYTALRYVAFIRAVLGRIRFWLVFLAIGFSLLLISLNVYSFEPHQSLIWSLTAIFAVIGFICLVVLMQAHRDPVLSSITGTKPNQLEPAFYFRIAALGAVPLFTLLSTHFPAIGRTLFSFVQPGLDALK